MCGIAGILRFDGERVDRDVLQRMTDIIAHRGPDGEGHWLDGPVGLGHRRLSIIDLSHDADQPMVSRDGKAVIVFNGEIYNYRDLAAELEADGARFRTHSDTEVILQLYRRIGKDCVNRLRGMFAFAIWDADSRELFLARDRVGIKPLYFLRSNQAFVFASEIKAVVASGLSQRRVSQTALAGLMRFLVVPQPDTIFDDVFKLEPGRTLLVARDGTVRERVYWTPDVETPPDDGREEGEWIGGLNDALLESVRYHMVADVPIAAFLSGGLDSSAVVTLMRDQSPAQKFDTFSIAFPGQQDYDESRYARKVAELNEVGHQMSTIDATFTDDLGAMAWHLDEPFAISSAFATWYLAELASRETKVVLTGDGGDELFAGYTGYADDRYLNGAGVTVFHQPVYNALLGLLQGTRSRNHTLRRALNGLRTRLGSEGLRYSQRSAHNSLHASGLAFTSEYFYPAIVAWPANAVARYYDSVRNEDRLRRKLYADYKTRLVDEMLMKVDRMTMAHSLEARVPLLDHEVVEFAFRVPSDLKLRRHDARATTKYIFKRAMESHLPRDIIYRDKQGFDIPFTTWLNDEFLQQLVDSVSNGVLWRAGVVDANGLQQLVGEHVRGQFDHANPLLLMLVIESWAQQYETRFGMLSWA